MVADSLAAFQADLEARGVDNRVLVHVWSEFGRRAQENGSSGTDHGAAGTSLLIGSRVNGGMIGELLTRLADDAKAYGFIGSTYRITSAFAFLVEYDNIRNEWMECINSMPALFK